LSTLTKILIVLLTLSCLFLCGYVVQYIATADNFKTALDKSEKAKADLKRELDNSVKKLQQTTDEKQRLEDSKNKEIAGLTQEKTALEAKIRELELAKTELDTKVQSWVSIVDQLTKLTDKHRIQFESTFEELNKAKGELITEKKKLDDVTSTLMQKESLIDMLENQTKRLTEEKMAVETRLNKLLQPAGKKVQPEKTFIAEKEAEQEITPAATTEIGLKAKVSGVDTKNSMAKISIGSSDGVKKGMRFHISRGNDYICDILIIDIAAEESVGLLELIQKEPRIGDNASTNL
jgi:uncharacterized protein YdiU (UPF0061 family)